MVLVLGDAHADEPDRHASLFAAYDDAVETRDADDAVEARDADEGRDALAAVQAGDLCHYDLPVETWFVAGNGEDLDVIEALRRGESPTRTVDNAHLLASTAAEIEGLTVAGLSGNYAPTKYDLARDELAGDRRRHFTHEDVDRLLALGEEVDVDVLVTHEAPHGLVSFGYDPGSEPVDDLLDGLDPSLCLVGHYHRHREATIDGTRAVSLAPAWESYYHLDSQSLEITRHSTPAENARDGAGKSESEKR